jgi:hypothetical protein
MIRKIVLTITCCCSYLCWASSSSIAQSAANANICTQQQCVKIQDGRLWVLSADNATYAPYFVKAVGYSPIPVGRYPSDWGYSLSDPRFSNNNIYDDPAILSRDFSLLQEMNANTIRIWNGAQSKVSCPCPNNGRFTNYLTNNTNTINPDTTQNTMDIAASYGLKIIAGFWLNTLTFDANNIIGSTDDNGNPLTRQQIINNFLTYVNTFKANRAILFWAIGNENNYQVNNGGASLSARQLFAWYSLVNAMAQAAHAAEGTTFHPVAVVNGEIAQIGNIADGATDAQLPYLDLWGVNIYRGKSFSTLFSDYAAKSHKPLWISEFGIDAWSVTNTTGINNWGSTLDADLGGQGTYDPSDQSSYDGSLWDEILNNSSVTVGGSVMEYSDEWWKPYEFYCTSPSASQAANSISAGICNSNQKYFGNLFPAFPDDFMNQEWFGIVAISPSVIVGDPDIVTPRPVYTNLQAKWLTNPWTTVTLNTTGTGSGTFTSSSGLAGGLNCNFSSGSSTGTCSAAFTPNQPITLSFTSSDNSTVTNWGVSGCASGNLTCTMTPGADIIVDVTATDAPVTPTVILESNSYSYTSPASVYLSAFTSETNGTIAKVEFYNGGVLIATSTVSTPVGPYSDFSYIWNNSTPGNYSITAKVYDSNNNAAISAPTTFTISGLPSISLTAKSSSVNSHASVTLIAIPVEPYGTFSQVFFYNGSTLLGTSTTSPYAYIWSNVPNGTYTLTAMVIDSANNMATSTPVTITVSPPTAPIINPTPHPIKFLGGNRRINKL